MLHYIVSLKKMGIQNQLLQELYEGNDADKSHVFIPKDKENFIAIDKYYNGELIRKTATTTLGFEHRVILFDKAYELKDTKEELEERLSITSLNSNEKETILSELKEIESYIETHNSLFEKEYNDAQGKEIIPVYI